MFLVHNIAVLDFCYSGSVTSLFLISNFRRVLNVVCFLLGNSPASEFCMPTFRNTLFHLHRRIPIHLWRWNRNSVPKGRHIKSRRGGITQKKAYNIFISTLNSVLQLVDNACTVKPRHGVFEWFDGTICVKYLLLRRTLLIEKHFCLA